MVSLCTDTFSAQFSRDGTLVRTPSNVTGDTQQRCSPELPSLLTLSTVSYNSTQQMDILRQERWANAGSQRLIPLLAASGMIMTSP